MRYKIFIVFTDGKSILLGSHTLGDSMSLVARLFTSEVKSISISDTAQDD